MSDQQVYKKHSTSFNIGKIRITTKYMTITKVKKKKTQPISHSSENVQAATRTLICFW
jgi:hypothetical protein